MADAWETVPDLDLMTTADMNRLLRLEKRLHTSRLARMIAAKQRFLALRTTSWLGRAGRNSNSRWPWIELLGQSDDYYAKNRLPTLFVSSRGDWC